MLADPALRYWVAAAVCGALAVAALLACLSRLRRDRFIADTPLCRIRSAAQGYVRIEGRAAAPPGEDLRSPLSGRVCVWWDYQVDYKESDSRDSTTYRAIEKATSVTPFVLSDGDGECLIGPVGAEVTPNINDRWYGSTPHPSGPPPEPGYSLLGSGDYVYHERLITPGTKLSVLGELRSHTEFGAVDQKTQDILAQWKLNQPALLRQFDRNHDGQLDSLEWDLARAQARQEAEKQVFHSPIERVGVVAQTTHGGPFLIAPLDAQRLIRRERRNALLLLALSVLLLGTGLWALTRAQQAGHSEAEQTGD
jgi:E3 Ubiquitin ligase